MTYEALGELKKLVENKLEGKRPKSNEFKPLMKIIADTGFLPYNEKSLDKAVDILLSDIRKYKKGKESIEDSHWSYELNLNNVDNFIIKAGIKNNLIATPEQVVKRIFSRYGYGIFQDKALEILEKVKGETKRSPAVLGAAVVYIASEKGITQRDASECANTTEVSIRNAYQEILQRHPEYSVDRRSRMSRGSNQR